MSNENIKSALWSARRTIRAKLIELEETASENRSQLRYYRTKVKDYKDSLDNINRRKRKLQRELKKAELIEYDINPIKNIHKASKNADQN